MSLTGMVKINFCTDSLHLTRVGEDEDGVGGSK